MERENLLYRALNSTYDANQLKLEKEIDSNDPKTVYHASHKVWGEVIVKAKPRNAEFDEVLHEGIVGLYALNNLRPLTRCFSLVRQVNLDVQWEGNRRNLVVYEEIIGTTLFDYFGDIITDKINDAKKVLLTLLSGLNVAHHQVDFTHYDLHGRNIIIHRLQIPLTVSHDCKRLFTIRLLPVIIDYGRSHVKIGGQSYGWQVNYEGNGWDKMYIKPVGFWQHDVFQLLSMYYQLFNPDARLIIVQDEFEDRSQLIKELQETYKLTRKQETADEIKFWEGILVKNKELREKAEQSRSQWIGHEVEHKNILRLIERLMSYFIPAKQFDYAAIIKELGRFSHLVPTEHNKHLNFDEFLDYAISQVDIKK